MSVSPAPRPIWSVLEHDGSSARRGDAAHWVAVYADLLALLARGARVTVAEAATGQHVTVDPDQVSERLLYWRGRLDAATLAG